MSLELPAWPARRPDTHKGDFGRVDLVAGSTGMTGAACLAAEAAVKTGAGLITVIVPRSLNSIFEVKLTCPMTVPAPEAEEGHLGVFALDTILERRCDVRVVGPGLGRHKETVVLVQHLCCDETPLVLDADGLFAAAQAPWPKRAAPAVLTPHPGEMAMLLGVDGAAIQADRAGAVRACLEKYPGSVVLLKGHETLVGFGDKRYRNRTGNPGMASGGSGDVLAGMIAALMGQGFSALEAACLGAHLHGFAGDLARDKVGEVSLSAVDLLAQLPRAIRGFRS